MSLTNYYSGYTRESVDISKLKKVVRGKDMDSLLYDLLTTVSPHGKEKPVADIIIKAISKYAKCHVDDKGNLIASVGDSKVMFSCHMDTVQSASLGATTDLRLTDDNFVYASKDKEVYKYKRVGDAKTEMDEFDIKRYAKKKGFDFDNYTMFWQGKHKVLFASDDDFDNWQDTKIKFKVDTKVEPTAAVLGADDKLGCYIMCKLIQAGVKGLYVFHVGEECGGIGSKYISETTPEIVEGYKYCIAFDRMDYGDIITNQSGGRCCSNEFAQALADELNIYLPPKQQMSPSASGVFTDSANYTEIIPECTNVSVGYKHQHSSREKFDLEWLQSMLLPALLKVKWHELPVKRDPKDVSSNSYYGRGYGRYNNYNRRNTRALYDYNDYDFSGARESKIVTNQERQNQSCLDKIKDSLNKLESFDQEDGFAESETHKQKVQRVLYSWIKDTATLEQMAEQVVDAYDEGIKKGKQTTASEEDDDYWYNRSQYGFDL
tara:strand:- start:7362 stop:8831 length:1470 start_codon:yes stop_codon:yes gene_type:complete